MIETMAAGLRTIAIVSIMFVGVASCEQDRADLVIGSKNFTESVILGEALMLLAREAGVRTRHQRALGGTRLVFNALAAGEIDAYVEYSGTLSKEIYAADSPGDRAAIARRLARDGITLSGDIGFENNYALGMPAVLAEELNISSVSDLGDHPNLAVRISNEFLDRDDGWPGLRDRYALPQTDVRGIDHDIAYRALAAGDAHVTDLYTTDAEIAYYNLIALEDNAGYFTAYDALLLVRSDLATRVPAALPAWERILGAIDRETMAAMNAAVKLEGRSEADVAAEFLSEHLGVTAVATNRGLFARILDRTLEHLLLVGVSLFAAILVAVPLGTLAARVPVIGQASIAVVGIGQTIPALALLVILVPVLGIGAGPALVALFIYSLLPIMRNTQAGITGIAPALIESARALGLPSSARLKLVELPLALPTILAGIKTAAVINIGGATLGALVGAGGYGQPILTGIRLDDTGQILEGAIPAAALALAAQWAFERVEHRLGSWTTPKSAIQ
jgi:osmoprotectant transport system permease protein